MADWKKRLGSKLVDLADAVSRVKSGNVVVVAPYTTPLSPCARHSSSTDVKVILGTYRCNIWLPSLAGPSQSSKVYSA